MKSQILSFQRTRTSFEEMALVFFTACLISFSGMFSLPLPISPIPIALQPHVVLLSAAVLGRDRGVLSVASFLMMGTLGLPVFSLGASGAAVFFNPTGGYLIGYLFAAFVVGHLIQKESSSLRAFLAMLVGNGVIYFFGAGYLSGFIGVEKALLCGVIPFLLGDLLKLLLAAKLFKTVPRL